jgi:hypothetical protein
MITFIVWVVVKLLDLAILIGSLVESNEVVRCDGGEQHAN